MNQEANLPGNNTPTLLFIDDEANILTSLKRLFRPLGYNILTAASGAEGLAQMEKHAVDLVICDMRMPEMDGAEVLERIRINWPDVVRILLTGYAVSALPLPPLIVARSIAISQNPGTMKISF